MAQRQGLREVVQQKSDEFGVQFHAGEAGEVIAGTPNAPRPLIGAGRKQGVKDIGDRDQLRMGMDLIPAQAQVAAAVQALMVLERHGGGGCLLYTSSAAGRSGPTATMTTLRSTW